MNIKNQKTTAFEKYAVVFLCATLLAPWLYVQPQMSINSDSAWLYLCAERLISGTSLTQSCLDPNPPMSMIIYMPMVMISGLTGMENYITIIVTSALLILFGLHATNKALKNNDYFTKSDRLCMVFAYLCTTTIITSLNFSEREHYIAILSLPYIINGLSLTKGKKDDKTLTIILSILAAIAFLVKPHYGLIPAAIFIHRIIIRRSIFSLFKDIDFLCLAALTALYIISISLFFNDYITNIFPDVAMLYLGYSDIETIIKKIKYLAPLLGIAMIIATLNKPKKNTLIPALTLCGALSLAIFAIQMKGFSYHLLPFFALIAPVIILGVKQCITKFTQYDGHLIAIILCAIISYLYAPLYPQFAHHADYDNNNISAYIDEHCPKPCTFYMTHENMDIMNQIIFYSNHKSANRFPSFWFQPAFEELFALSDHISTDDLHALKEKYKTYIAQDITEKIPTLLLIQNNEMAYLIKETNALSHYKKTDTIEIDRAFFYKDTRYDFEYILRWDVYTRID